MLRDPSNPFRVASSSKLPHILCKIDESVSENCIHTFVFYMIARLLNFLSFSRPPALPQGLLHPETNTSQDFWNMPFLDLVNFHRCHGSGRVRQRSRRDFFVVSKTRPRIFGTCPFWSWSTFIDFRAPGVPY